MTNWSGASDLMTRESSVEPMTGELVCSAGAVTSTFCASKSALLACVGCI